MQFDYFSRALTNSSMYFEIVLAILLVWIFIYWVKNYKFFAWRFFALAFWVFAFEWITWALWINSNLWQYAYLHNDISWVMTLTWTSLIFISKFIYDKYRKSIPCILKFTKLKNIKNFKLLKEFIFVTIFSSILWLLLIILLKSIWVFSYSPEMLEVVNSWTIIFWRPLEALVYFPVFIFTVYSFYKYWELAIYNKSVFNTYSISIWKDVSISIIVIFLIWYLINPLLNFPNFFAYFSLTLAFLLVLLFTNLLISIVKDTPLFIRFISGSFIFTTIWTFIISLYVKYWIISFSDSIKNTYTDKTFTIPYTEITDVEWVWLLLFSYLMIAVVKYFKVITDNKEIKLVDKKITFKWYKSLFTNQK